MKRVLIIIGMLLVSTGSFAATLTSLNKDDVSAAFSDKTITTIDAATLNDKLMADVFTGYFSKDGKVNGMFASKPEDGPQTDTGTWKTDSNGMLCYKWDHWDNNKEQCVSVYKLSNGLLVINKDNGFESMIMSDQIKTGNQMPKSPS